ncbi:MAG: CcmD family protein [Ekhidna sp.]|nr:CcmD family protein [Ekhidna sp.]MBC6410888.1 CcmD family protein [Ekhidna sp.]MBC6427458.1 CcmD family protein [Ekhidna sp.]
MRNCLSVLRSAVFIPANAQVQMADNFRSEGKIYVVLTIILILLAGFFFLLFKLDNRTKRLEKELKDKEQ